MSARRELTSFPRRRESTCLQNPEIRLRVRWTPAFAGVTVVSLLFLSASTAYSEPETFLDSLNQERKVEVKADSVAYPMLELPAKKIVRKKPMRDRGKLDRESMKLLTSTMGDPVRALTAFPEVNSQSDVNARPFVRGGKSEETRVMVNGLPLLQAYHIGGAFSIFNQETVDKMEFTTGGFPAESNGSLSGLINIRTRKPSLNEFSLHTDVSLLRGNLYTEVPIMENRAGVYFGTQMFLFNYALTGAFKGLKKSSDDEEFKASMQDYADKINLPAFHDYQYGTYFLLTDKLPVGYSGSLSYDDFQVVIPAANNIIRKPDKVIKPAPKTLPDVDLYPKAEEARTKALAMDSISTIRIENQNHFVNIPWMKDEATLVENSFGYQAQDWGVKFKEGLNVDGPLALSIHQKTFNYKSMAIHSLDKHHQLSYGVSYDRLQQNYQAAMPWALYDVIVNSNMDMLSGLGFYSSQGFVITRADSSLESNEYLGEFPLRLQFNHTGVITSHTSAVFASHQYKPSKSLKVKYGLRTEYENNSREIFLSPRVSADKILNPKHHLGASAGLYSQNNFAFYKRDVNRGLKSEKAAQLGTRYKYLFNDSYNIEWKNYYKQYYDLAVPVLVPEGSIDPKGLLIVNPHVTLTPEQEEEFKGYIDDGNLNLLSDSLRNMVYAAYGNQNIHYVNRGTGQAYGTELSLNYRANRRWRGWVSGSLSRSLRKDSKDDISYNYRYHRPWSFNWVNYFDMPSNYEISFTYRLSAGHPYTPYTGTLQEGSDVLDQSSDIIVGQRNSGELEAYSRTDIRLSKNTRFMGNNLKTYIEVWNTFNQPNYFARDKDTGQLKSAELNWPFPFFFVGLSYDI